MHVPDANSVYDFIIETCKPTRDIGIPDWIKEDPDKLFLHLRKMKLFMHCTCSMSEETCRQVLESVVNPQLLALIDKEFADAPSAASTHSTPIDQPLARSSRRRRRMHNGNQGLNNATILSGVCQAQLVVAKEPANCGVANRLEELTRLYSLTPTAKTLLLDLFLLQTTRLEESDFLHMRHIGRLDRLRWLASLTSCSTAEMATALAANQPLLRFRLVDSDNYDLADCISAYLEGISETPFLESFFLPVTDQAQALTLDDYPQSLHKHLLLVRDLILHRQPKQGAAILLYGKPGTGKTAAAMAIAAVCRASGYRIYTIPAESPLHPAHETKDANQRRRQALTCMGLLDSQKSLVICDEADDILCEQSPNFGPFKPEEKFAANKASLNEMLDNNSNAVIFITNCHWGIDDSTKRRFDYSIRFAGLGETQMQAIWERSIRRHGLEKQLNCDSVASLAKTVVQPGGMEVALRAAKTLIKAKRKPIDTLQSVLAQHMEIMGLRDRRKSPSIDSAYALEAINLKGRQSIATCLDSLRNFHRQVLADNDQEVTQPRNFNVLLSGPPGTGKTEFVKYLATELGCELVVHSAGSIMSKFVGETESNIRDAFDEGRKRKAILFFDEIDSLLINRQQATRSYEVSQVTELLIGMERFHGIFLAATNCPDRLDPACQRRFTMKVEFDYLAEPGKQALFERFLASLVDQPPSPAQRQRLLHLPGLTPGCFHAVRNAYSFRSGGPWPVEELLTALQTEATANAGGLQVPRIVGFADNIPCQPEATLRQETTRQSEDNPSSLTWEEKL